MQAYKTPRLVRSFSYVASDSNLQPSNVSSYPAYSLNTDDCYNRSRQDTAALAHNLSQCRVSATHDIHHSS